ncbi:hypothetical protein DC498_12630 [Terrimonas sp.]|uniref:hypothetical protein n=1 Tax=Terrimonas sp. TaxID=1914338 RepID=UPI000D508E1F|nr:hypothetical protein [Terrimonas sp.]PVD51888.1 hypothetical protein DC498_12630 [Terrimonas sp.]
MRPCSKKIIADPAWFSLNGFYNAGAKYYTDSNTSNDWTFYWSSAQAPDVLVGLYLRKSSDAVKARIGGVWWRKDNLSRNTPSNMPAANKSPVLLGSAWNTLPGNSTDFTVQLSDIMLFEAMAELKRISLTD